MIHNYSIMHQSPYNFAYGLCYAPVQLLLLSPILYRIIQKKNTSYVGPNLTKSVKSA